MSFIIDRWMDLQYNNASLEIILEGDNSMKQFYGMSQRGNLDEALQGLYSPQFIMLLSNNDQFEEHVAALERRFPGVPSIGCIGMSYQTSVAEHGVGVIAFSEGVTAAANVLEQASTMPVKYIKRLEEDMRTVGGTNRDTVCIDFCSGNDACVLTTIYTALCKRGISLVGGTGDQGKVSANGRIYQDILHVTDEEILTRTFQNPFGKLNGDDTCIISIKEVKGNALACFRQVNDSDVLILLELGDYKAIVRETIQQICRDFPRRSAIFSVNCLFRYKLFSEQGYMQGYLRDMSALGNHAGFVGYGEHYNNRFVNQSMTCVVFE